MYVGAHPSDHGPQEERILWVRFDHGPGVDGQFYPTVYTLWHNSDLLPLLYTPEVVIQKLRSGADLMTPGIANEPPFPEGAVKGAVVAVASLDKPTVPLFVGKCEIDVSALGKVQGTKGHAVRGLHWEGDELWAWSLSGRPGQPAPDYLAGWDYEADDIEEGEDDLTSEEKEKEKETREVKVDDEHESEPPEQPVHEEHVKEPTTKGKKLS